jgi:hypothetical protein
MTTKTAEERWKQHIYDALVGGRTTALHRAIRKYGEQAFKLAVLFDSECDQLLFDKEREEIAKRGTASPKGYNLTVGGDGGRLIGEGRRRHADSQKRRFADPTEKQRYSEMAKAQFADPEARRQVSVRTTAYFADPEARRAAAARSNAQFADPQVRQTISERSKAQFSDPEARRRVAVSLNTRFPNVFADGQFFASMIDASRAYAISVPTVRGRCDSKTDQFRFWQLIPNHNDPECDAVEQCWFIMQWAEANPDHESVPAWAKAWVAAAGA